MAKTTVSTHKTILKPVQSKSFQGNNHDFHVAPRYDSYQRPAAARRIFPASKQWRELWTSILDHGVPIPGFCPNTNNRDLYIIILQEGDLTISFSSRLTVETCPTVPSLSMRKDTDQYGSLIPGDFSRVPTPHPHPMNPMTCLLHLLG